jgi:NhaP-type Na+/H+ or K+/H+ antiporter
MIPFLLTDDAAGYAGSFVLFVLVILVCIVSLFIWILPGIIASNRKHHNTAAIWAITLLLGWSFVGWVVALVWAFTNPPPQQITISNDGKRLNG